jgi:hypothetical protein
MKIKYIYLFFLPAAVLFLAFSAFLNADRHEDGKKRNDEIIKFSHSLHADLAECQDCHSKVLESTSLKDRLFPDHDNCNSCHDTEDADACNTCHYEDNYEALVQSTEDLLFNHKFHLDRFQLQCSECHKGINVVDYAFQAVQPNPPMSQCYSCHNDRTIASNACESCHISTADLLPADHRSITFRTAHKFQARGFNADCIMCHDINNNSCEVCHAANNIITETNLPGNFYQAYSPNNFVDDARQQKLTRAHDLNYRFFHGIDARGKSTECQSCHQTETFCAQCHQSEHSDFAMAGIMPASHLKPGFFTFGVGTGGGEHATLARRDIERCSACHDVQGIDPVCFRCHSDPDGIKGTNSKTHAAGFMRNERGDWHDTQGSVCYNCHTSASPSMPAGMGFCGYCHGGK